MRRDAGSVWGDDRQRQLIRAALLDGDAARRAFGAWASAVELDGVDAGSRRLLPLLFRNLVRLGVESPLVSTLQAEYRDAWCRNQRLIGALGRVVAACHAGEIDTAILKGVALSILHYRDRGARPMADADLLVPAGRYHEAVDILRGLGWRPERETGRYPPRYAHAWLFVDAHGLAIDLHAHLLSEGLYPGAEDRFWARMQPMRLDDVTSRALGPADQLFHVIVHGLRWNAVPTVRWIADAAVVIRRSADTLDWEVFVDEARRWRLTSIVGDAITHLATTVDVVVPPDVRPALERTTVSWAERLERRARLVARAGWLGGLPDQWFLYTRWSRGHGRAPGVAGFLRYLRGLWGIRWARLPAALAGKAARQFRDRARRSVGALDV
jgi:hypothetical protein